MADLTSKYQDKGLRDVAVQACVSQIEKLCDSFPDLFTKGAFTDFFDIQGGTQPPKSQFIFNEQQGYVRFLQIRDFSSESTRTFIPIDKKNKLCNEDDVLLGRYGASVGKILTGKKGAYNVACAKIVLLNEDEVKRDYIFYLLHSLTIQNTLKGISRSAQGGFNKGDLDKIEIKIPKFKYQEAILNLLMEVEKYLIEGQELKLEKTNDKFLNALTIAFQKQLSVVNEIEELNTELTHQQTYLTQLRQAILQDAVMGKLSVGEKVNKEDAKDLLAQIKTEKQKLIAAGKLKKEKPLPPVTEDEIPFALPKGWVWCRLGEVGNLLRGKSKNRPRNDKKLFQNGTYPFIQTGNVSESKNTDYLVKTINGYYNEVGLAQSKMQLKGTLCITIAANIAECGFLDFDACVPDSIVCFTSIDKAIERYVFYFLRNAKKYLEDFAPSTAQKNINLRILTELAFPLPPLSEQQRIVNKVEQLMQQCSQLEQTIQQSQQQAKQLLQAVLREAFEVKN